MQDLIKYLLKVEQLAHDVYSKAAVFFADDPQLSEFLAHTAEDEAWHSRVLENGVDYFSSHPPTSSTFVIDAGALDKIIEFLSKMNEGMAQKTITRRELVEQIVEVELSEWNDIFLYVVNTLKEKTSDFKYPAARIQAHVKAIEHFIVNVEKRPEFLERLSALPAIWVENILIVDDERSICELTKALLNRDGNIDIALNGQEALSLIKNKYYKLIISDIDMPIMNGLTLYEMAIAQYPEIRRRFLFISGNISSERDLFFRQNRLPFIQKPFTIETMREESTKILLAKQKAPTKRSG
jgi:CheY-like chemotaxis protein